MSFYIWLLILVIIILVWFLMSKNKKGGPGIGHNLKHPENPQAPKDQSQQ